MEIEQANQIIKLSSNLFPRDINLENNYLTETLNLNNIIFCRIFNNQLLSFFIIGEIKRKFDLEKIKELLIETCKNRKIQDCCFYIDIDNIYNDTLSPCLKFSINNKNINIYSFPYKLYFNINSNNKWDSRINKIGLYIKNNSKLKEEIISLNNKNILYDEYQNCKFLIILDIDNVTRYLPDLIKDGYIIIRNKSNNYIWLDEFVSIKTNNPSDNSDLEYIYFNNPNELNTIIDNCLDNLDFYKQMSENNILKIEKILEKDNILNYMEKILNSFKFKPTNFTKYSEVIDIKKKLFKNIKFNKMINKKNPDNKKFLIIVPFRYNKEETKIRRDLHLKKFLKHYNDFDILIVEQSKELKFNRGTLLNIGAEYAIKKGYENLVFHDVDAYIDTKIAKYYFSIDNKIIALGKALRPDFYPYFFGLISVINVESFIEVNGFPNYFYGWGGEDDALVLRLSNKYKIYVPEIKEELLEEIQHEKTNKELQVSNKNELIVLSLYNMNCNGLNSLKYDLIKEEKIRNNINKITVKLI